MSSSTEQDTPGAFDHRAYQVQLYDADDLGGDESRLTMKYFENKLSIDKDSVLQKSLLVVNDSTLHGNVAMSNMLTVNKKVTLQDELEVTGKALLKDSLTVMNDTSLMSIQFDGDLKLKDDKFQVDTNGNVRADGTALIQGKTTLKGNLNMADRFDVTDDRVAAYQNFEVHAAHTTLHSQLKVVEDVSFDNRLTIGSNQNVCVYPNGKIDVGGAATFGANLTVVQESHLNGNVNVGHGAIELNTEGEIKITGLSKLDGGINVDDGAFTVNDDGVCTVQKSVAVSDIFTVDDTNTAIRKGDFTMDGQGKASINATEGLSVMHDIAVMGESKLDGGIRVLNDKFTVDVDGQTNIHGDFEIAANKFKVEASTGNTMADGTLSVKGTATFKDIVTMEKDVLVTGALNYTGLDNSNHNVESEIHLLNTRVGAIMVATDHEQLDSLAKLVDAFSNDDGILKQDIQAVVQVIDQVKQNQELLRNELVKVAHYLHANHSPGYLDEQALTLPSQQGVVDMKTGTWMTKEYVALDLTSLHNRNCLIEVDQPEKATFANAGPVKIPDTDNDLLNGMACFKITLDTTYYMKVAVPTDISKTLVIANDDESHDNSVLYFIIEDHVKVNSTERPDEGKNLIKLTKGQEISLWARPDNKWSILTNDGEYVSQADEQQ